jgi:dipeptidyl-peptidase-4
MQSGTRHRFVWVALVVALGSAAVAARQDPRLRELDEQIGRIFGSSDYQPPRFGPARWLPGGTAYTTVERSADRADVRDIVRYDAATGERTVLVAGTRLIPAGGSSALSIDDYIWSADAKRLLVFTNTKRVWRQNTRGDSTGCWISRPAA